MVHSADANAGKPPVTRFPRTCSTGYTVSGDLSARPPNYRRNATALVVNRLCSAIAFSFVGVESVMPAFVRRLTTSAPLVGLIGTVFYGGLLLPQAVIARAVTGRTRKKPFASAALAGRVVFFIVAAALWARTGAYPAGMLALFFFCLAAFALADGAAMVGWYDIIGRAIPASSRARLYGLAQAIGALAGVGVGAFIGWILGEPDIQFPASYAILFALAGAFFIPSSLALLAIREPDPAHRPCAGVGPSGRGALRIVIGDRRFRRMIACRLLIATMNLSTPFYVGHAADVLGLPEAAIGTFTIAYTASTVVASLLLGSLGGRRGDRPLVRPRNQHCRCRPALFCLPSRLRRARGGIQLVCCGLRQLPPGPGPRGPGRGVYWPGQHLAGCAGGSANARWLASGRHVIPGPLQPLGSRRLGRGHPVPPVAAERFTHTPRRLSRPASGEPGTARVRVRGHLPPTGDRRCEPPAS